MSNLTAETRRHGEEQGENRTAETRRRGEENSESLAWRTTGSYQGTSFSRVVKIKDIWALAPAVFRNGAKIARAVLREVFDESAYERFLLRTASARSVASYRAFLAEREVATARRPRCC